MEKFLNRKVIYEGKILRLDLDQVECENGKLAYREIVRHNGGAAILCITKENKILFIKQFRYAYNEVLYEIPAGKLEQGEDPLSAASREFEEETGQRALDISYLTTIYPTCGYSSEKIFLYLVTKFEQSKQHLDEDEFVEPLWIDLRTALDMIQNGTIKDAKTICAIQAYLIQQNKIQIK
ncbi:MAG: NUDIX hydrolase [Anaeroplasmataceae bacterium]|nr:NUDIX hydrolase [Anaeroplasmataceae bacterium]